MRPLLAIAVLTAAATALPAQTSNSPIVILQAPHSVNCPVGIAARHTPQGAVEQVSPGGRHHPLGFEISLRAFNTRLISQANVTLSGIAGAQVLPAVANPEDGNTTETFTLTPGEAPTATLHSVVYTRRLTGVLWIDVNDVTYSDGTEWHQKPGSLCRVAPSGLLLVGATAR